VPRAPWTPCVSVTESVHVGSLALFVLDSSSSDDSWRGRSKRNRTPCLPEALLDEQLQRINFLVSFFSSYREIFFLNFNIYGRSTSADWFSPFLYEKGDVMSPLSIRDWREIIRDWEKIKEKKRWKINLQEQIFSTSIFYIEKNEKKMGRSICWSCSTSCIVTLPWSLTGRPNRSSLPHLLPPPAGLCIDS